jgi:hypothetical protein
VPVPVHQGIDWRSGAWKARRATRTATLAPPQ